MREVVEVKGSDERYQGNDVMKYAPIYAEFIAHCDPVRPPGPWSRFGQGNEFRRVPAKDDELVKALRDKYPLRDLVRSGVIVQDPTSVGINPIFLDMPNAIVPVRSDPGAAPFDLITSSGTASGRLPLSVAVQDHQVKVGVSHSGYLFAAFDVQDFICLRALGMPVVPACGLDRFTPTSVAEFRNVFDAAGKKASAIPHHLVLSAWSPCRMTGGHGPTVDRTVRALQRTRSCLGLPQHNILFWQPTTREIQDIANCLRLGKASDVIEAISSSLTHSSSSLAPESAESNPIATLLEKDKRLHAALMDSETTKSRWKRLLREHRQAAAEVFVKPTLKRAEEEPDQGERVRLMSLAKLSVTLHSTTAWHAARIEKAIMDHGLRADAGVFDLQGLVKGFDVLLKLTKEKE